MTGVDVSDPEIQNARGMYIVQLIPKNVAQTAKIMLTMNRRNKARVLFLVEKTLKATGLIIALVPGCQALAVVPLLIGRKLEMKRTHPHAHF